MRQLHLQRDEDVSGVSGIGIVAYGVEFPDGTIVLRWDTQVKSTVFYACVQDLETIVGHGGKTKIVFEPDLTHRIAMLLVKVDCEIERLAQHDLFPVMWINFFHRAWQRGVYDSRSGSRRFLMGLRERLINNG
jgi:hypothetical protein